ncbi:AzlC family ABC transporter permease [Convivina praedatoris]|uniref:Inner membrane protein YgaZ n=1 Tax=Convivina praedatoris TaxID=2880963 RepID=A0ABN8H826_9LACO|nr:AzlC family ABC transporter permease [Convivina sp. LMG 32447]CAH1852071.1 Inner membrane protein YgaZ [Convivina sp. LMG 32447]CAH1852096.1 Inner membrane protein YgaZ [Convivina sp. LMG 32447]CAH1852834.1 Inner membrane protein YgaZ [Convivina sp. LMG 32447]
MNNELKATVAVRETLPTVFGYLGIGLAFGIVARAAGINSLLVTLTSLITYAGSAQFIMVGMFATGNSILAITLSVFLVNARMILMSMTVAPLVKHESLIKNVILGTLLTDESFALAMNKSNLTNRQLNFSWFNTVNLISYATWVCSSLIGALVGSYIQDPEKYGLSFALIAMFIGLLYLQIINDRALPLLLQAIVVLLVFGLVFVGLIFIPSQLLILLVTILSCILGVVIKNAFF